MNGYKNTAMLDVAVFFCIKKTPGYAWGSKKLIAMSINKKPPLKNKIRFANQSNQRRFIQMDK
ncbi:MAG: hypothetical protein J6D39_13855, partial [Niameybacter sp.]|nr:hypothetical protein [Niameybacter sp.]